METSILKGVGEFGLGIGLAVGLVIAALYLIRLFVQKSFEREKRLGEKIDLLETEFREFQRGLIERQSITIAQATEAIRKNTEVLEEIAIRLRTRPCLFSEKELRDRQGITQ